MKNTYFVLRHGYTDKNEYDLVASFPEVKKFHLTDDGKGQVQESANWLLDKGITLVLSSDLERAKESADIVAKSLEGVNVVFDERLREINFGEFNGKTHAEFDRFYSETKDLADRFLTAPPGGESLNDVARRVASFFVDTENKYSQETILIISHGDPIWIMLWLASGKPFKEIHTIEYPQTGSVQQLLFNSYLEVKDKYVDV